MPSKFLLDADAFITAKRNHYGLDFCPGYWDALLKGHDKKVIASIIPVRKELIRGKDDLADWVKDVVPKTFFKDVQDVAVQSALQTINDWVMQETKYSLAARQRFVGGADPWLIAYAKINGYLVVTYEVEAPESKTSVKLPDVATAFSVDCRQPAEMLRESNVKLRLGSKSFK